MLVWKLTDLLGHPFGRFADTEGGEVTIPRNDDRKATVTVSMYDPLLANVEPLSVLLKCYMPGSNVPIFSGPIYCPAGSGQDGKVELRARGPSLRLEKAPLLRPRSRYHSLDQLVNRARPKHFGGDAFDSDPPTDPLSVPDHGIARYDGERRGPMPRMDISLGQSVWETIRRASDHIDGPDFDIRPIDHVADTWDYAELDIWEDRGTDRSEQPDLVFNYGWGRNNLLDCSDEPAGDRAVNVYFAGVTHPNDDSTGQKKVWLRKWKSLEEVRKYGAYVEYEAIDGCAKPGAEGIATVAAYRVPPTNLEITLAAPGDKGLGVAPTVFDDFDIGDLIKVVAKKGYWNRSLVGKVTEITVADDDHGITRPSVKLAPAVGIDAVDEELLEA